MTWSLRLALESRTWQGRPTVSLPPRLRASKKHWNAQGMPPLLLPRASWPPPTCSRGCWGGLGQTCGRPGGHVVYVTLASRSLESKGRESRLPRQVGHLGSQTSHPTSDTNHLRHEQSLVTSGAANLEDTHDLAPDGRIRSRMGVRNYLVEGVSGTGKTSVCRELRRRGYHAVNGDTDLAYQGDPETGESTDVASHWHHIWSVDRARALGADQNERFTFFCGGSRNFAKFLDLFDGVFVLEVDLDTLNRRLDQRPADEFGAQQSERDLIVRLHRTKEDTPTSGILIDATAPLVEVVDEIVRRANAIDDNNADPA